MSDPAAAGVIVPAGGVIVPTEGSGNSWAWPNGGPRFGDMVWGKVKSHPWWPGHVYNITLTDNAEVHRGHRDGLILVAFFGDSSYGWFEPHEIVPFEEHFAEKTSQGVNARSRLAVAIAEAVDEVARRAALGLLCPCQKPDAFRPHPLDATYLLVDVPGFDTDADYHPDQIATARDRFVPRKVLSFLLDAAVTQRDAADAAARTLPGMEMAGLFAAYRRTTFVTHDETYVQAFIGNPVEAGADEVDPVEAGADEEKAAPEKAQRARPLSGRKTPTDEAAPGPGRRRGGASRAAARLMKKIMPGAAAMKAKSTKKDKYLLKRRNPPPEPAHRPATLPNAVEDRPPGFGADPPTPPLPGSTVEDEELMLQRRAPPVEVPPPAAKATEGADVAAPKKATTPKMARKREPEEAASAGPGAPADAAGEPNEKKKKKLAEIDGGTPADAAAEPKEKKKKKLAEIYGGAPANAAGEPKEKKRNKLAEIGCGAPADAAGEPKEKKKKKLAEIGGGAPANAAGEPKEKKKKKLAEIDGGAPADAAGEPKEKKKKLAEIGGGAAPNAPSSAMAVKKKAKLDKIKTLSKKKAGGLEQKVMGAAAARPAMKEKAGGLEQKITGAAAAGAAARPAMKGKATAAARKKEPAPAPRIKTPSPTALMMKFPLNTTLPSVASLKARFARFGPLDVDGIRVYWKFNTCRVIYRFKSDAETALKYARTNPMFGQVDAQFHMKEVEKSSGGEPPAAPDDAPQRSDLRLMETAPFRPGTSGNDGSPLPMSSAVPARATAMGQLQPKSILKKRTGEGGSAMRECSCAKFMLDTGNNKLEPSALPTSAGNGADNGAPVRGDKSVGFAPQPALQPPARNLQPPMRPTQQQLQPPRAAVTQQQLPPPPPLPYQQARSSEGVLPPQGQLPYPPRHTDGPPAFSTQLPSQQLPYPPRHNGGMSALPGQPPLPYQSRSTVLPGQQQQPYPPRNGDSPPVLSGQPQQQPHPRRNGDSPPVVSGQPQQHTPPATDDVPAWKRSKEEFKDEVWRVMTRIAEMVEPLTDKNGFFPYHLFGSK